MRPMSCRMRGASLIEVLVALTVFTVGVLGLMGMQATAVTTFSDAKYRADAALLAERLIGQAWINRASLPNFAYAGGTARAEVSGWLAEVRNTLPAGDARVVLAGNTLQVTVNWTPGGGAAQRNYVAVATIQDP